MAEKNKKSDQIECRLHGISTEQFATLFEPESQEYKVKSNIKIAGNYDSRTVAVKINIQFLHEERVFMQITAICGFEISEEPWNVLSENCSKNVVLQSRFIKHIVYVTYNTIRGVLHAKTENTPFNRFPVPLLGIDKLKGGDFVIEK